MAYLINGNGFAPVTAQQDADLYGGIVGLPLTVLNVGEKMAAYVASNTDVHILDGEAVCQGRRIHINAGDYDSFAIPTGTVGVVAYYIIGYHIYTDDDTGNEIAETFVRHMNNSTETIPEDVLRDGASECYVSMYRITLNGLSITATDALYSMLTPMPDIVKLFDKVLVEGVSLGNVTVNANGGTASATGSASKTGYKPLGIVGVQKSGAGNGEVAITAFYISNSSITISYRNGGSSQRTIGTTAYVLYKSA